MAAPKGATVLCFLREVYQVIFLDAVHVKICDGKVANRPIYLVLVSPLRAGPFAGRLTPFILRRSD